MILPKANVYEIKRNFQRMKTDFPVEFREILIVIELPWRHAFLAGCREIEILSSEGTMNA